MSKGISAHGTVIKRNNAAIAELKDITPPPLTRNAIELTTQNDDDDAYIVGVRRKGEMTFKVNFLQSGETSHGAASGLLKAYNDATCDLYEIDFPDGATWLFSGYVTNVGITTPVDGALEADITIRPTNAHVFTPGA